MKYLKFFAVAIPLWFAIMFGISWAAEILRIPDTDIWMWILRVFAAIIAVFIAWIITGSTHAQSIAQSVMAVISIISNLLFAICIIFGIASVLMVFIKDYKWVYDYFYEPFIARALGVCIVSVIPFALLLMIFHKTRALGGIALYLLTYFFGFSLWLYTLIYAASSGLGWVIGGLIGVGIGIVPMAIIAAVVHGQWAVAGVILLAVILIWFTRFISMAVAAKELEKEENAAAVAS